MFFKKLILIAFSMALTTGAWAHDVWLVPADGEDMKLVFGHPGSLEPYNPGKVVSVSAVDRNGKHHNPATTVRDSHLIVTPPAGASVITVDYDHGIWTMTADGDSVNQVKGEVPNARESAHEQMHGKALLRWSDAAARPVGSRLEIVPLADPFALSPGDELPVQLLYEGKPLAGAEIEMLGVFDLFFTDREGMVNLPLPDEDFQYILAMHGIPLGDCSDTDQEKLQANLTFSR